MPLFLKWYNFVCEKLGEVVKQESTYYKVEGLKLCWIAF